MEEFNQHRIEEIYKSKIRIWIKIFKKEGEDVVLGTWNKKNASRTYQTWLKIKI